MAQDRQRETRRPLRRGRRHRRHAAGRRRQDVFLPSIPGGVVNLGRWAGIFVVASAVALPVLRDAIFLEPPSLQLRLFSWWSSLASTGAFGVIILLLAEVADRLRRPQGRAVAARPPEREHRP